MAQPRFPELSARRIAGVSSLWTPEGEHRVPREGGDSSGESGAPPGAGGASTPARDVAPEDYGDRPSQAEMEAELAEVARQLGEARAEDVVSNHCYGLFELAAIHLSQNPPGLDKARLAIDAMGLLVDGLGERLGEHLDPLSEGLTQLRMAYVRIAGSVPTQNDGAGDKVAAADPAAPEGSADPTEPVAGAEPEDASGSAPGPAADPSGSNPTE